MEREEQQASVVGESVGGFDLVVGDLSGGIVRWGASLDGTSTLLPPNAEA